MQDRYTYKKSNVLNNVNYMRILLKLRAKGDYAYDPTMNHKIQGFIYRCVGDSFFGGLHERLGPKYFCFSNIFPIGSIRKNDEVNLIISSPITQLIQVLKMRIQQLEDINIGEYSFKLSTLKLIRMDVQSRLDLITGTPVVIRLPKSRYKEYKIKSRRQYEYWKETMPLNIFIDAVEENFIKKYNSFHGTNIEKAQLFERYEFKKEVGTVIRISGEDSVIVGSIWKFSTVYIDRKNTQLFSFLLDTGLGEMNSLGYGFLNKIKV